MSAHFDFEVTLQDGKGTINIPFRHSLHNTHTWPWAINMNWNAVVVKAFQISSGKSDWSCTLEFNM